MGRVLLIGGTSHVGKSTLAAACAARLGWRLVSTDALARHPGRPWGTVPDHVRAHYLALSVDGLADAQLQHYERLWPTIAEMVRDADRLVLEGSGILPARVAASAFPHAVAHWLTADPATLTARVHEVSGFARRSADERFLIEKFLGRTMGFDQLIRHDAERCLDAGRAVDDLVQEVCAAPAGWPRGRCTSPTPRLATDVAETARHGRAAREAWQGIDRPDLVADLTEEFGSPPDA